MTTLQEIEVGVLTAIATAVQTNSTTLEGLIATGEADIQAGLVNLIKNIPSVKGALALVVGPIEAAVEASVETYIASVIAKETPASLVALLVAALQALAKQAGG